MKPLRARSAVGGLAITVGVAGAAFAFVSTLGIGVDHGSVLRLSPPDDELVLSLADPAAVGDPAVFGKGKILDVVALNPSDVTLTLSDKREVRPELKLPPGCPKGSFVVNAQRRTNTAVPAHNTLPIVVGSFRLRYVDKPGQDQSGCSGADINFEWDGSHA